MAIFNMSDSSINEYLSESDKTLKNEKKVHPVHGPEDYSKFSNKELKQEFDERRKLSQNSKNRRSDRNSYTNGFDYGTSNRRKAAAAGSELKKRGYDLKLREAAEYILSVLDEMDTIEDLKNQKKNNYCN